MGHLAIGERRFNRPRAAVGKEQSTTRAKFVAFGVTAKVIVIVEDENASVGLLRAPEISSGEAADATADDDEIVRFAGVRRLPRGFPEIAVAQFVRVFKRTGVAATEAGQSGWIVAGRVLRGEAIASPGKAWQHGLRGRGAHADGDTV